MRSILKNKTFFFQFDKTLLNFKVLKHIINHIKQKSQNFNYKLVLTFYIPAC